MARQVLELRDAVVAKPGAAERLAGLRAETLEEIRLYELATAGDQPASSPAVSTSRKGDLRSSTLTTCVSTLRQYLEALGARLELVAVFDDDRRVPVHLGHDDAA